MLFFTTMIESVNPDYGSGSNIGGVGLVFILGMIIIVAGIVIMFIQAKLRPDFFRNKTLSRGIAGDANEADAALPE